MLAVAGLAILGVFSLEPVANAIAWNMEHDEPSTIRDDVTYDAVVLLGGVTDERVTASTGHWAYNDDVERLVVTHRLLRDGKAKVAILSGAAMDPSLRPIGEARVLAAQLRDWGIPDDRLVIEERARNTRENAVYAAEIIRARGYERVLVVTSAFHLKRARECFDGVGLHPDMLAVDFRAHEGPTSWLPRARFLAESTALVRELFGRLIYRARGYARSPAPSRSTDPHASAP